MDLAKSGVRPNHTLYLGASENVNITELHWANTVMAKALPYTRLASWPTSAESLTLPSGSRRLHSTLTDRSEQAVFSHGGDGTLHFVKLAGGRLHASLSGQHSDDLADTLSALREAVPPSESRDDAVQVTFWTWAGTYASARSRMIEVPSWDEIRGNYSHTVAEGIDFLTSSAFSPGADGRVLLWHGPPGTGKTWALRALASEWRDWCDVHYISDPETLFGAQASYLMEVFAPNKQVEVEAERWRLIVLEDSGELMTADAKSRTGQGLSRLLNMADGLLGQGLRTLVLITTNEDLRRLEAAVSRPGRCAQSLEFGEMGPEEVARWREENGLPCEDVAGRSLAELYAEARGTAVVTRGRAMGFA